MAQKIPTSFMDGPIQKRSPRQILLELHNSPGYPSCQRPGFLSRKLSHDIMERCAIRKLFHGVLISLKINWSIRKHLFSLLKCKMFKFLSNCFARLRSWKSVSSKTVVDPSSRFHEFETLFAKH